jgi:Uma2 family endonuclease
MEMIALDLSPLAHLTGEQFYQLCVVVNRDISLKRTAKGELVIVAPVGGENRTGDGKSKLDSVLAIHP